MKYRRRVSGWETTGAVYVLPLWNEMAESSLFHPKMLRTVSALAAQFLIRPIGIRTDAARSNNEQYQWAQQ
jgi:hypothetical protein